MAGASGFIRTYGILIALLVAQIGFWSYSRAILPNMEIVPDVPGKETVKALSLGDEQFYFRLLAMQIQNSGDTYGRFTPLREYDYAKLKEWFLLLDTLDNKSNFIPSLATYYYSQTQNVPDVRYIVDYLVAHADGRVEEKWWWLIQAIYLANHKLENKELALEVGKPLMNAKEIPLWARQFPAFIYEQMGEPMQALYVIEHVLKSMENQELDQGEFNFMKHFIEERLKEEMPDNLRSYEPATPTAKEEAGVQQP